MTQLLMMVLGIYVAYAIYIATLSARMAVEPGDHLDAGGSLPPWAYIFAGSGVVLGSIGLENHFLLTARFGLQYSHVAIGLVLVALSGALVQKRTWLAARITGHRTAGNLMGEYYGSTTIRIFHLALLFLFAVPFSATALAQAGTLLDHATGGALSRPLTIWVLAFFLFLHSVIGGWRGVVYTVAAQSVLVFALLLFIGAFAGSTLDLAFLAAPIATPDGMLADAIPGVVQFSSGVGKSLAVGGIWTTAAILSFAVALIGIVLSPGFSFLGITSGTRSGFAVEQVWMTGGLAAGLLLIIAPLIGAEIAAAAPAGIALASPVLVFAERLASNDQFVAICFLVMLVGGAQIVVGFFAGSAASVLTQELVARSMRPDLTQTGRRLASRISLCCIYLAMATAASFAPLASVILGSLALSLSAQLLPAFLGLCWLPWISRSAVLAGLIVGILLVVFTEPFGLILFEGLFLDLPWGRWPLTIHSAAWGLAFNVAACLLVSIFTRSGDERAHRQRLHDEFGANHRAPFGSSSVRGAKWSLTLIWAFLALGPGAILGNNFFSNPVFGAGPAELGVPSLWVWQILFWFVGIMIVWWLAYRGRMSIIEDATVRRVDLSPTDNQSIRPQTPAWIAQALSRIAAR
jgi:solute:Na+ symporter, SSS family